MTKEGAELVREGKDRHFPWGPLIRVLLTALVLGGLFYLADFSEWTLTLDARLVLGLLLSCGVLVLTLYLSAVRWKVVLTSDPVSTAYLSRLYFIGWFFSQFLPSSIGGDAARVVGLSRSGLGVSRSASSILLERAMGLAALLGFLGIGAVAFPSLAWETAARSSLGVDGPWIWLGAASAGLLFVGLLVFGSRNRRVRSLLHQFVGLWTEFASSRSAMGRAAGLSVLVQGGYIAAWILLAWAMRVEFPLLVHLFFVPAVSLAALLPVTVSGLGIREGFTVLVLAPFGVPMADAVAYGVSFYVISLMVGGIGGILFLRSGLTMTVLRSHAATTPSTEDMAGE